MPTSRSHSTKGSKDGSLEGNASDEINLIALFQSFRTILCICPHCGGIQRVSDLHLKHKSKSAKTWLDTFESQVMITEKKEKLFEEEEQRLREEAIERGRKKVPQLVRNSMHDDFVGLPYNPYDIKALLHPVDFVVFDGMNEKEKLNDIVFLSRKLHDNPELSKVRNSIKAVVEKGSYSWQVARVDLNGSIEWH